MRNYKYYLSLIWQYLIRNYRNIALIVNKINPFARFNREPIAMTDFVENNSSKDKGLPFVNPFTRIPNVGKFEITLSGLEEFLLKFNLKLRLKPQIKMEKYNNSSINRYIEHQVKRLNKMRHHEDYWILVQKILERSKTFFVYALRKVEPKWHRTLNLGSVIKLAKDHERLVQNMYDEKIDYRRVYIPKDDSLRPLGVPTLL